MASIIREAPLGQMIRWISSSAFRYIEEREDYELPQAYIDALSPSLGSPKKLKPKVEAAEMVESFGEKLELVQSIPITPCRTLEGQILVDWYATDDPDNPHNWPRWQKNLVLAQISVYTFVIYCASAIYVPAEGGLMHEFGVSQEKASLGLAIYVLGYGIGPMLFSPMSEIPLIGRNPPYLVSLALFLVISVATALVKNYPGFIILRFLQGFFGSPGLATGGASLQDIYAIEKQPYALTIWMSAIYCGPALGPLLSSFAVVAKGWRWSMWEIVWMAGPVFILVVICLPETSGPNLLLRRARRLRKRFDDDRLLSQSEIDQANIKFSTLYWEASVKPAEIGAKDPAVMFTNIYTMIVYGIYYSFFEAFPLVYGGVHRLPLTSVTLIFLCNIVGVALGTVAYWTYLFLVVELKNQQRKHDLNVAATFVPESSLIPALPAVFGPPIGLFLFAWTGTHSDIHWIVPTLGITIFAGTSFIVFQCITIYVPATYPAYAASLFAGNDFFRASFAAGAVLFAGPMFDRLGVAKGVSLLGGLSVLGIIGMWVMYYCGPWLRSKSSFATK